MISHEFGCEHVEEVKKKKIQPQPDRKMSDLLSKFYAEPSTSELEIITDEPVKEEPVQIVRKSLQIDTTSINSLKSRLSRSSSTTSLNSFSQNIVRRIFGKPKKVSFNF
jgi:hypothetical protein